MGLFDKKFCDICGEKIGMLGNRKLEDGNMCKDCAKKLSPFCDDRRHSTLEQMKAHLQYREENKNALRAFSPNLILGESKKVYIDTMKGQFVVSSFSPGNANWTEENPDVMPISSITSCGLDIDEDRDEIYMKNGQGQNVSYNPPRYNFYYNFKLKFLVNNPYFDDFEVRLNNFRIEGMGSMEYNRYQKMGMDIMNALGINGSVNMAGGMGMQGGMNMGMNNMGGMPMGGAMPMNNMGGFAPQGNMYGQQMGGYQQAPYGQPQNMGYQQNPYGQQMPQQGYGQPMQNNMYGQPQGNMYNQQAAYGQQAPQNNAAFAQAASATWVCDCCGNTNDGAFCTGCGNKR